MYKLYQYISTDIGGVENVEIQFEGEFLRLEEAEKAKAQLEAQQLEENISYEIEKERG